MFYNSQNRLTKVVDDLPGTFSDFIGPDLFINKPETVKHSELLNLMDEQWLSLLDQNATQEDIRKMEDAYLIMIHHNGEVLYEMIFTV